MAEFKHHSTFAKAKHRLSTLYPFVCLACRKSFKKSASQESRKCSQCGHEMLMLGRKFSPPKQSDAEQWKKVEYLIKHGFVFQSVYRLTKDNKKVAVPYPQALADAPAFVKEFASQAISTESK